MSITECLDFNVKVIVNIRVYYCDIGSTLSTSDSVTTLSNGFCRFSSMEVAIAFKNVLVGHIPMELSFLLRCFLDSDEENGMLVEVTGHRMRENRLVGPCRYRASIRNLKISEILHKEIKKAAGLYTHMPINLFDFKAEKKVCFY